MCSRKDFEMLKATVCIPTWNGMRTLPTLLDALQAQVYSDFDVLIVDSSSNDGTFEFCASRNFVELHSIPKSEFSHSGTRQYMAEIASGNIVVFLTQDSIPADHVWLKNLLLEFQTPTVACSFSRHISNELLSNQRLEDHFSWLKKNFNYPLSIRGDVSKWNFDLDYRRGAHFNSDNAAAYRRDILMQIPFPNVNYGEDQIWADQILNQGYAICFASESRVIHWNFLTNREAYSRGKLEANNWNNWMEYNYRAISFKKSVVIFLHRLLGDIKLILKETDGLEVFRKFILSFQMNIQTFVFWAGARSELKSALKRKG